MIFLETERLILRNLKEKDLDIMYDYRNNINCIMYQRGQTVDKEGLERCIKERKDASLSLESACLLAIAFRESDEMVGEVVVMPREDIIFIGYTISYKYHRQGVAFEILSDLLDLLHDRYPQCEFCCQVDPKNTASIKLLKKLGYKYLGYDEEINSKKYGKWTRNNT